MAYTYSSSVSGDKLTVTDCGSGHVQLVVPSGTVCISRDDIAEVVAQMTGYAAHEGDQEAS